MIDSHTTINRNYLGERQKASLDVPMSFQLMKRSYGSLQQTSCISTPLDGRVRLDWKGRGEFERIWKANVSKNRSIWKRKQDKRLFSRDKGCFQHVFSRSHQIVVFQEYLHQVLHVSYVVSDQHGFQQNDGFTACTLVVGWNKRKRALWRIPTGRPYVLYCTCWQPGNRLR